MKNLLQVLRFFIVLTVGVLYGLLFAQKTGKKLRKDLSNAENPYKKLFEELKAVDKEAFDYVKNQAKESESIQKVIEDGRKQFDGFTQKASELGEDAQKQAKKALEDLAQYAKESAQKLSDYGKKKVEEGLDKKEK